MDFLAKLTDKIYYLQFLFNVHKIMKITNHTWYQTLGVPNIIDIHNNIQNLIGELEETKDDMIGTGGIEVHRIVNDVDEGEEQDVVYEIKYSISHFIDKNDN